MAIKVESKTNGNINKTTVTTFTVMNALNEGNMRTLKETATTRKAMNM